MTILLWVKQKQPSEDQNAVLQNPTVPADAPTFIIIVEFAARLECG